MNQRSPLALSFLNQLSSLILRFSQNVNDELRCIAQLRTDSLEERKFRNVSEYQTMFGCNTVPSTTIDEALHAACRIAVRVA
ncbi:hypothetical protein KM539_14095 [Xanthomonas translucens pv. poae]|uniref:hypothetical protein n=1 Tax=Xanthomonas graminis TaxID=3390026 RepID=UPI001112C8D5|nr:hypothetical protein [Xanthomonas translucens]UKE60927.1 hypothetical protein KM539_14095 [Xanthomonas translucens pv. poae]